MENIFGSNHFNSIATHLKKEFGCKVMKLSLNGGFTCPNRDGTVGVGGCAFCSEEGSGHFAGTLDAKMELLRNKDNPKVRLDALPGLDCRPSF